MIKVTRNSFVKVVVGIYVLFGLYFLFIPSGFLSTSSLGRFYKSKILIGPFFSEVRIRRVPNIFLQTHHPLTGWSNAQNISMMYKHRYEESVLNYTSLMRSDYLLYLSRNVPLVDKNRSTELLFNNRYFKGLHLFNVNHGAIDQSADSVTLTYIVCSYQPKEKNSTADTLWQVTYSVEAMKNPVEND